MTDARSLSFGRVAEAYERARPAYPADLVEWLAPGHVVVDVGAGTGKLTGVLAAAGREVVAVEPDPAMLAQLSERFPGVTTHLGPGEELPLPDGSADAVVYGQAWHWVDEARAGEEAARVLRPGGVLGAVWNVPDRAVPWVDELQSLRGDSKGQAQATGQGPNFGRWFARPARRDERWSFELGVDGLVALMATRSEVITGDADARARTLAAVRAIAEREAGPSGELALPYLTVGIRAERLEAPASD
ncbi:MAG: class I SAM-dependent methyltransferase [Patulibacter minatonensis]